MNAHYAAPLDIWNGLLPDPDTAGAKEARTASLRCPECSGQGLTHRYHSDISNAPSRSPTFTCYCHRCAFGRFMERNHRTKAPEIHGRIRDLASSALAALREPVFSVPAELRTEFQLRELGAVHPRPITQADLAAMNYTVTEALKAPPRTKTTTSSSPQGHQETENGPPCDSQDPGRGNEHPSAFVSKAPHSRSPWFATVQAWNAMTGRERRRRRRAIVQSNQAYDNLPRFTEQSAIAQLHEELNPTQPTQNTEDTQEPNAHNDNV